MGVTFSGNVLTIGTADVTDIELVNSAPLQGDVDVLGVLSVQNSMNADAVTIYGTVSAGGGSSITSAGAVSNFTSVLPADVVGAVTVTGTTSLKAGASGGTFTSAGDATVGALTFASSPYELSGTSYSMQSLIGTSFSVGSTGALTAASLSSSGLVSCGSTLSASTSISTTGATITASSQSLVVSNACTIRTGAITATNVSANKLTLHATNSYLNSAGALVTTNLTTGGSTILGGGTVTSTGSIGPILSNGNVSITAISSTISTLVATTLNATSANVQATTVNSASTTATLTVGAGTAIGANRTQVNVGKMSDKATIPTLNATTGMPLNVVPPGVMMWNAGNTNVDLPGWLICNGRGPLDGSVGGQYRNLYLAIGTSWGGSGTNFYIPTFAGYSMMGAGQGSGLTNRGALNSTGGANSVTLNSTHLPLHSHAASSTSTVSGLHTHGMWSCSSGLGGNDPCGLMSGAYGVGAVEAGTQTSYYGNPFIGTDSWNHYHSANNSNYTGSAGSHNNLQPYLILRLYIKT